MKDNPIIIALPVGEFDTPLVKNEFDAIIMAFQRLEADLLIADPILDEAGALHVIQELAENDYDLFLIVPLRGLSARLIEVVARASKTPCLIWPVQGRFALPSSALANGTLQAASAPVELLYGPPDNPVSIKKIECIARAAKAFSRLRKSRIGVIGGLFPNLVSCRYDPQTISSRLGATLLPISFDELREAIQSISQNKSKIQRTQQEIASTFTLNPTDGSALEAGIKLHLALRQIAHRNLIDGFATECWTGFPRELGLNPCLGFIEDAYTLACEGDVMMCLSLLIAHYLTGRSTYVGDLFDLDLDGIVTLVHCGAPASLSATKQEVVITKSQIALERGFETMTCRPRLEPGLITLFRFYGENCDRMHVAMAELLSSEQSPSLAVRFKLTGDRWDFLEQCFGNHYLAAAGDIRDELKQLGKWLGITIHET